jgi:hypothetical protein
LWSSALLLRLKKEHVYANCVNRDYEGEIKAFGDTIRINQVGPITLGSYTKNTVNLTPETVQGAGESLTIDQAKYFYFAIDDVDKAQIKGNVMETAMDEAAYQLRDATDSFLATTLAGSIDTNNVINSSSVSAPISVGPSTGDVNMFELLIDMNVALNKANVPSGGRWVVLDPTGMGNLLKDPRFTSFATAGSLEVIKQGSSAGPLGGNIAGALKTLIGMDVYVSNNVPVSSSVYSILAGYKGAATYAEQIPEGQPEAFRLQTGFADAVRGFHLYGAKITRPSALSIAYVKYVA